MIEFNAGDERGEVYCDFCNNWAFFYALTEEEFIDEVLASGWEVSGGEWKCPQCQRIEGIIAHLRTHETEERQYE